MNFARPSFPNKEMLHLYYDLQMQVILSGINKLLQSDDLNFPELDTAGNKVFGGIVSQDTDPSIEDFEELIVKLESYLQMRVTEQANLSKIRTTLVKSEDK